jgi:hypothetical protein
LELLGKRLQFSRANLNHLINVRRAVARLPELNEERRASAVVALLEPLDEVGWLAAWAAAPSAIARSQIERFACEWRFVRPTLTGHDLRTIADLKPGPIYGQLVDRLRRAWLDAEISTPAEERALLDRLLAEENLAP